MNTLLNKIVAVTMMVGAVMMFLVMMYNISLMFGRTYIFKYECIVLFAFMALMSVVLFSFGVKQYKGEEL